MKIEVRVKPNSKTEEVAAIGLLAKHFGVSATRLRISKGLKSRTKVIEIL
jgi:uncharacterized protein YggU (UPF0235/DUF167 family)